MNESPLLPPLPHPPPTRGTFSCAWRTLAGLVALAASAAGGAPEGLPPTRFYPFEEIGCSSRRIQLLHDSFGRMAVAQQGEFFVLNDATWQKAWRENVTDLTFRRVLTGPDNRTYYGAFGSWGVFRTLDDGTLRPTSLVPADAPKWVRSCNFTRILFAESGVFFHGLDGVVFLDRTTGAYRYFPIHGVANVFTLGDRIVVTSFDDGMFTLAMESGEREPANLGIDGTSLVIASAGDGRRSLLLGTANHRLLVLRDGRIEPVNHGQAGFFPGSITCVAELAEGGFAASIAGYGIVTIDPRGAILRHFDGVDFRGVTALESREPGVLWAATERGVLKILHGQPFTTFGRDQGLLVDWPQIVNWQGRPIIASGGRIFEPTPGAATVDSFRKVPAQPFNGGWGIAAVGGALLIGNGDGVFRAEPSGGFTPVLSGIHVARLVALDDDTCLAIGVDSIAALRCEDGRWAECAPRLPGIGYPYIVHSGPGAAWIELGLNRVARVALAGDRLELRLIEQFAWDEPSWVNVSLLGATVVLCGSGQVPMFLDGSSLEAVDEPALRELFDRSPYYLQRVARDAAGNIWASHDRGLFLARLHDGHYEPDFATYAAIKEATPLVQCPPGGAIWASAGNALYQLQFRAADTTSPPPRPVLVGLQDTRTGLAIPLLPTQPATLGRFPYSRNSIRLDLFAGTHALVRPFDYEYRLDQETWVRASSGSSALLTDLHEGSHGVEVRMVDNLGPFGAVATYHLDIEAPWYRTWWAFSAYPILAALIVLGVHRFSVHRARTRMADLARQVEERTRELRAAMGRLRQETQTSATLAERNRLAMEIHDSLEQGFTGLGLQLETTASFATCPPEVKAGLAAALNMVAFSRNEVRHVLHDLHSASLESADLGTALQGIIAHVAPTPGYATFQILGTPVPLGSTTEHHLLRIAQEAVANALKHAAANHLQVTLSFAESEVQLAVRDDGAGFEPAQALHGQHGHFGLPSLRGRAAKIGGTVAIVSSPGAGTEITVRVPLPPIARP